MKYKAHDYQQYATDFIIGHPVSCLILDMGLGKTVITLTALWLLLFDYTPYLATINNLDTPVIKTADKTMKITYTITEE